MPNLIGAAAACTQSPCPGQRLVAFGLDDLNPLTWLGSATSAAIGSVWQSAMIGLWSAGLWLLQLAFDVIDAFTTPELSAGGPMGAVLPTTLWIGATVAGLMMSVQLIVALIRRDGQSIGRVFLGTAQFGVVWLGYLGVAAGVVAGAGALQRSILAAMLNVDRFSGVNLSTSWPRNVDDVVLATVLGALALLLVIPSAFFYLVIMLVRAAALIVLVATAPISAAGLLAETSKVWFWKSLRWFISCVLIAPTAALILGIGVKVSAGVVSGAGDKTAAAAGMAVIGCVIIAIGACCPLVMFRLLAFVDPSSASGAALRQSWSDAGGMSGVLTGQASDGNGSSAATSSSSDGRASGEAASETQTGSRLAAALGAVGQGAQVAISAAHRAADIGSDVLGAAGVGHPGYTQTFADTRARGSNQSGGGTGRADGGDGDAADGSSPPAAPTPPLPAPTPPTMPGPPGGIGEASGPGAAGSAGGTEAAGAAVVVL